MTDQLTDVELSPEQIARAVGDEVNYMGVPTTIKEVRTIYVLAGGSHAQASMLRRRPPAADPADVIMGRGDGG